MRYNMMLGRFLPHSSAAPTMPIPVIVCTRLGEDEPESRVLATLSGKEGRISGRKGEGRRVYLLRKITGLRRYCATLGFRQTCRFFLAETRKKGSIAVSVRGLRFPVKYRLGTSDRHTIRQVLFDRDSDVRLTRSPKFIIDGGANVGYASALFASKYPDALIYAVEPEERNCIAASGNLSNYPNVRLIKAGLWTENTSLSIDDADVDSWSFTVRASDNHDAASFPGVTIGTLLQQSGFEAIDLVKLDIEGTETAIFSDPDIGWLEKTEVVVIEVHGEAAQRAVLAAFAGKPFLHDRCGEKHVFTREGPLGF